MRQTTVRRRIFISNALIVLVSVLIFLAINLLAVKLYSETIEADFLAAMGQSLDEGTLKEMLNNWVFHRNEFYLLLGADGILCVAVWIIVSRIVTGRLVRHVMEPLEALTEGAKRIRGNDLTSEIAYRGDQEFEEVCEMFNGMQKHLLEEQEKNQKYERARTDMIAGISHDLRTPLTAVRGTIKGLMDGIASSPEQQRCFLETAYRRTGDIDRLLNQLLELSRIETGSLPISLQQIVIAGFLQNYVKGKSELMDPDREEIQLEVNGIFAEVSADPGWMQRIFDNLLENSRKYAEAVPLQVQISLSEGAGNITVCVRDNGVGVPEKNLPFLFDEFYRCDESRGRKDGNGLGLYIVKYLMQAMGGDVRAENAGGLAVYLTLPLVQKGETKWNAKRES